MAGTISPPDTEHSLQPCSTDLETAELPNGLQLVIVPLAASPAVAFNLISRGGSSEEPVTGTAHFTEHMLFSGTARYGNTKLLTRAVERHGAFLDAETTKESVAVKL